LLVEPRHLGLSIRRQCELIGLARSSFYYEPLGESERNLSLMRRIDEQHLRAPFFGVEEMTAWLRREGERVNPKRIRRLMRLMGIEAMYPKPHTSRRHPEHKIYPYLLRDLEITRADQVWASDITYVPMHRGFMYLVAIMDWFSRYVVAWQLSNSLDVGFCLECLDEALATGRPEIFNTDQGSQFTSSAFTGRLEGCGVAISMDGRGRALDNVFIERLWRTVKYEEIYPKEYENGWTLETGLSDYFEFYGHQRPHSSLGYHTPAEVYFEAAQASAVRPRGAAKKRHQVARKNGKIYSY
jgi:putative transposase